MQGGERQPYLLCLLWRSLYYMYFIISQADMARTFAEEGQFLCKREAIFREVICFKGQVWRMGKEMGLLYF